MSTLDYKYLKQKNPHQILSVNELRVLNVRCNWKGLVQMTLHLTVIGLSGYLWGNNFGNWLIAIPALVIYGFSLASMFAAMHETVHRTAFANNYLNAVLAWCSGLLCCYNSTFYRYFHKWHHRYTQIPGKDPELNNFGQKNLSEYLLRISRLKWWYGRLNIHYQLALGQFDNFPFIPEIARSKVIVYIRCQLAVYALVIIISVLFGQPFLLFFYWLLPLIIGQPIMAFILIAEHTGCSFDSNPLTNTRTTLTILPIRLLMWNMPFHAEHHLYPSIPFYQLPTAHSLLSKYFAFVEPGYIKVNRDIITQLITKIQQS
jgi:fatty acid desaturase